MVINGTNQNYGIRGTLVNGFTLQVLDRQWHQRHGSIARVA